jgi:hypothetical protein
LFEKRCRLIKSYGWSEEYIRKRLPGARGWAYYFWAVQNEATMFGNGLDVSGGYVSQEIKRLKQINNR